jgi:hypothetical protein
MKNYTSLYAIIALMVVALACGGSATPPPSQYLGEWTGTDGTFVAIRGDGSADYRSGASHITGGSVVLDEAAKSLKISFAGMGPTFSIDKAPSGDQMTLSGVVYKKSTSSSSSSNNTASDNSPAEPPSKEEAGKLVQGAVASFTKGVNDGGFDDFYARTSEQWKDTYTLEQTNELFRPFVERKADTMASLEDAVSKNPQLLADPSFKTQEGFKVLVVNGDFPSKPYRLTFETEYLWQEGRWKIKKFKVDL